MSKSVTNTRTPIHAQYATPPLDLGAVRKLSAWERARLAADWHAGHVDLRPTVRNAAKIFSVSPLYICAAEKGSDKPAIQARTLESAWRRASASERRAFVRATAETLWDIFVDITVPPDVPHQNGHAASHASLLG